MSQGSEQSSTKKRSRFLRAFDGVDGDPEEIARGVGQVLETTGCPYLVVVEIDGVVKHLVGPEGPPVIALLDRLTEQHFLEEVVACVQELEAGDGGEPSEGP